MTPFRNSESCGHGLWSQTWVLPLAGKAPELLQALVSSAVKWVPPGLLSWWQGDEIKAPNAE